MTKAQYTTIQEQKTLVQAEVALSLLVQLIEDTADKLEAWHGLVDGTCPHAGDLLAARGLLMRAIVRIERPLMAAAAATGTE